MRKEVLFRYYYSICSPSRAIDTCCTGSKYDNKCVKCDGQCYRNAKDTMSGLKENATNTGQNLMDKAGQALSNITGAIKEGIGAK